MTTEKLRQIATKNRENTIAFLKGFYEAEDTFDQKGFYARLYNTNQELLKLTGELLKSLILRPRLCGPYKNGEGNKMLYYLAINWEKDVRTFFKLIKPCIKQMKEKILTAKQKQRVEKYYKALELRKKGLSTYQISREIGIPNNTIWYWTEKGLKPRILAARDY